MSTCKASDARRHKSKTSKWDTAELYQSDSDEGDSFLDAFVNKGTEKASSSTEKNALAQLPFGNTHVTINTNKRNRKSTLRRIMSEQQSSDSSPLRVAVL